MALEGDAAAGLAVASLAVGTSQVRLPAGVPEVVLAQVELDGPGQVGTERVPLVLGAVEEVELVAADLAALPVVDAGLAHADEGVDEVEVAEVLRRAAAVVLARHQRVRRRLLRLVDGRRGRRGDGGQGGDKRGGRELHIEVFFRCGEYE